MNLRTVGGHESEGRLCWLETWAEERGHPKDKFCSQKQQCLVTSVVCRGKKTVKNWQTRKLKKEGNEFEVEDVFEVPDGFV